MSLSSIHLQYTMSCDSCRRKKCFQCSFAKRPIFKSTKIPPCHCKNYSIRRVSTHSFNLHNFKDTGDVPNDTQSTFNPRNKVETLNWSGNFNVSDKLRRPLFPLPTEWCDRCSSSLPQTQSTVVLIKSCAAFHTTPPMVILGRSQCDGGCKPPRQPITASISTQGAFMHSFLSISRICLNSGLEFDCETGEVRIQKIHVSLGQRLRYPSSF